MDILKIKQRTAIVDNNIENNDDNIVDNSTDSQ